MSITGLSPAPDKPFTKTSRHRTGSDELDVFEASRYFAGEPTTQKIMIREIKDENHSSNWNRVSTASAANGGGGGVRRISLDIPSTRNNNHHHHDHHSLFSSFQSHRHAAADQKQNLKDKKQKQPSSPGGRLASFLNSLFSQSSKKKKPKSAAASTHDPDLSDSPGGGGRRKRRSSISHFATTYTTNPNQNATVYSVSSKNSGFRTPPPAYAQTPIKLPHRSFSDYKEKKNPDQFRLRDEKKPTTINRYINANPIGKPAFDDGAESDSSSDLFELQNYDLGDYSSGLPVYETTHMDSIKRGAPISVHGP